MIVKIDDFNSLSANQGKCYIMNRPKLKHEPFVFRCNEIDFEGMLDISIGAVEEMAQMIGWLPPARFEETAEVYVDTLADYEAIIAEYQSQVEGQTAKDTVIRSLSRELDLAEAARDDAIRQFQTLEATYKKLQAERAAREAK